MAIDAADVVVMHSRLSDVAGAVRLSRATLTNIKENLFWAFIYNIIGIPLAAGLYSQVFGWNWELNPMFGAAAMSLSSFCVVTNALRLNFFSLHRDKKHLPTQQSAADIQVTDKSPTKEVKPMTKTLQVDGMMCMHCEARVKKALEAIEGVASAVADHKAGTATVTLTQDVPFDVLKAAV